MAADRKLCLICVTRPTPPAAVICERCGPLIVHAMLHPVVTNRRAGA